MTSLLVSRMRLICAASALLVACGSSDKNSTGTTAGGSSGAGGSAAGQGGAGSGGAAGSVASGGAGSAGTSGAAGSAGAGLAGASGAASGGTGGAGGGGIGGEGGGSVAGSGGSAALAKLCTDTKGKVITKTCCASTSDFADTCHSAGKCDCAPGESHEVLACDCSAVNDLNCFNLTLMYGCIPVD